MKIGVVIKITILCKKLANMEELVARQWLQHASKNRHPTTLMS
jgi:hypothetical protein